MKKAKKTAGELAKELNYYLRVYHRKPDGSKIVDPSVYESYFKKAIEIIGIKSLHALDTLTVEESETALENLREALKSRRISKGVARNILCAFNAHVKKQRLIDFALQMGSSRRNKRFKLIAISKSDSLKAVA